MEARKSRHTEDYATLATMANLKKGIFRRKIGGGGISHHELNRCLVRVLMEKQESKNGEAP